MRNTDGFFSLNIFINNVRILKVKRISLSIRLRLSTFFLMPFSIFSIVRPVHCDLFDERRPQSSSYDQKTSAVQQVVTFVHTFETPEQCAMICPRPCIMRVMEELEMMQRWICDPSSRFHKEASLSRGGSLRANFLVEKEDENSLMGLLNNQFLLVIVPFTLMLILCLIILIVRRCSSKSSAV